MSLSWNKNAKLLKKYTETSNNPEIKQQQDNDIKNKNKLAHQVLLKTI